MVFLYVMLVLSLVTILQQEEDRKWACVTILWVSGVSFGVYNSSLYDILVELIGYFAYISLTPLASIAILYMVKGRLCTVLMYLFFIQISVNITAWVVEGFGNNLTTQYDMTVTVLFVVEVALMYSRGVTDGIHRILCRHDPATSTAKI